MQVSLNYIIEEKDIGKTVDILFRPPGEMISENEGTIPLTEKQVGRYTYELLWSFFKAQLKSIPEEIDREAFIENSPIVMLIACCDRGYDDSKRAQVLSSFNFNLSE